MSMIGKEVQDFKVTAFQDNDFHEVTKQDLLGKWSVLFFYPADFSFVCPTELEDLQEHYPAFQEAGCEIYAISSDSQYVHMAWHEHSKRISTITYPMLADPTHALMRDLDVLIESAGQAERGTFILNPEAKVVAYEVSAGNVGRNADELLRKLQACQFVAEHSDEVCPARWKRGDKTLKPGADLVGAL